MQSQIQSPVVIATMHGKEKIIGPLLQQAFGVDFCVPEKMDTDSFGTFTNQIQRKGNQLEAAYAKLEKAFELTNCISGIASEGSFGPHPQFPWVASNLEILVFKNIETGLKMEAFHESTQTNFAQSEIKSLKQLTDFAQKIDFPSHGIILSLQNAGETEFFKELSSESDLKNLWKLAQSTQAKVFAETDMRSMRNPTRQKNIEKACQNLIELLNSKCPSCQWPGFQAQERISGLPCNLCGMPTRMTKASLWKCNHCQFEVEVPGNELFTDPINCNFCNP